ncbi:CYFA0S22e00364g1_1 [Cyberlindnera fabianii]|uniref:Proline dehydrogenase n=1 Tax=Cyberlindnera fabianii TaxID=36022 RepID=A0A061B884_CYBFA|nr:CYFA0S22e00364g1_1 [Cyberlindnera fabianii]
MRQFSSLRPLSRSLPVSRLSRGINTTRATKTTLVPPVSSLHTPTPNGVKPANYLESLSNRILFNYACIGLVTLNKPILNLVIKAFPLVPMSVIDFFIGKIYCGGSTPEQTIATGAELSKRGINNMMLSYTVEDAEGIKNINIDDLVKQTADSIDNILKPHIINQIESGKEAINDIPPGYLALKPSALVADPANVLLNYNNPAWADKWQTLNDNCAKITEQIDRLNNELLAKYPQRKSPFFVSVIDAEKYALQQGVYVLQRNLFKRFNRPDGFTQVVGTVQMYLKQGMDIIKLEEKLAKEGNYRVGLKLVRGAYIHSEPDRSVIHDTKEDTDVAYNTGIKYVLDSLSKDPTHSVLGHLVVASHNADSQKYATDVLASSSNDVTFKSNVVLGQLLGMCDDVTFELINNHGVKNIIKYVPWGPPIETKDYLLRRLQENGDAVRNDNGWPLVKNVLKVFKDRVFGKPQTVSVTTK